MTSGPTARVESVELRTEWPREQQDFSRWLVDNIDFLNEHLPFEVDPESLAQEQSAGSFFVDVIGDAVDPAGNEFKVVIENQLEETDHKHLGQILTYVSAFDAKVAIWISAKARPEHAKAVQWLNDESNIEAWLFDIEVIRIEGSPSAPLLRRIIGPSQLSARAKKEKRATEEDRSQKMEYWARALPVIKDACAEVGLFLGREASGNPYISQKAEGPANAYWQVWVTSHGSWFCLRIHGDSKEESMHYFEQLRADQGSIESSLGSEVQWKPLPESTGSVIRWDNPVHGGFKDQDNEIVASAQRLGASLNAFVSALQSQIAALSTYKPPAYDSWTTVDD